MKQKSAGNSIRHKQILTIVVLLFIISLIATGCFRESDIANMPKKRGSIWENQDSSIVFTVEGIAEAYGKLIWLDETVDVFIEVHPTIGFKATRLEAIEQNHVTDDDILVRGWIIYFHPNKFKIEIKNGSKYFIPGTKMTFTCTYEGDED